MRYDAIGLTTYKFFCALTYFSSRFPVLFLFPLPVPPGLASKLGRAMLFVLGVAGAKRQVELC